VAYADDDTLDYRGIRRDLSDADGLRLDLGYCSAHLPLIAPDHPWAILADGDYRNGCYEAARYSLVLPVPHDRLAASPVFAALDAAMRTAPFAGKIAWPVMARRQDKLHVTLCAGLRAGDIDGLARTLQAHVRCEPAMAYRLGAPLIGARNTGRLYFPLYPMLQDGVNAVHRLQDRLARPRTHLYLLGYYSLSDHLDRTQTRALATILSTVADQIVLTGMADDYWFMRTHDDLALSAEIMARVAVPSPR